MALPASGAPQLPCNKRRPSSAIAPGKTSQRLGLPAGSQRRPSSAHSKAALHRCSLAPTRRGSAVENPLFFNSSQDLRRQSTQALQRPRSSKGSKEGSAVAEVQPGVQRSRSASVPVLQTRRTSQVLVREVRYAPELKGEARRQHIRRVCEHKWLRSKGKHGFVDFTEGEELWLRRYFSALAGGANAYMIQDQLEDMLISLNLAKTKEDVSDFTKGLGKDSNGDLCFADFLKMVATRLDRHTMHTFKLMMEGKLGDEDLDFQTVISQQRRRLVFTATGAKGACMTPARSSQVMRNFAAQQEGRMVEEKLPEEEYDEDGTVPLGKLKPMWQVECKAHDLVENSSTAEQLEEPESPRSLIQRLTRPLAKPLGTRRVGNTLVIEAPHNSFRRSMSTLTSPPTSPTRSIGAGEHTFEMFKRQTVAWSEPAKKT